MSAENPIFTNPEAQPSLPVYVLDSFAVLAYLSGESAAKRVQELFFQAKTSNCRLVLPLVNLGEVLYIVERKHGLNRAQQVLGLLEQEPLEILPADRMTVLAAAHIKANYVLSYADAFVVSAAQNLAGILVTGDPEFHAVENIVKVEWLR